MSGSIEEAVRKAEESRAPRPCKSADAARVPCFPTSVEATGPRYSVADELRAWRPDLGLWGPTVKASGFTFDPVCAVKGLAKAVKGKNDTYYLYQVWDRVGPQVVLRERPFQPAEFQGVEFRYELIKEIQGECEALQAYRKALRELPPAASQPQALPSASPR